LFETLFEQNILLLPSLLIRVADKFPDHVQKQITYNPSGPKTTTAFTAVLARKYRCW